MTGYHSEVIARLKIKKVSIGGSYEKE